MHPSLKTLLVITPVIFVLACGKKETSREDVRSDLIESISLATEAETFVSYMEQGHATYCFASGHLHYLLDEVNRSAQELSNANASPDLRDFLNMDRAQLGLLAVQIENVRRNIQRPQILATSEQKIREIHRTLVQAKASL